MSGSPGYTEQQRRALESPARAVALEAGAGCGKTFVLTERLLAYLDPTTDAAAAKIEDVVAITFTDAAAREMRERVRGKCLARFQAAEGEAAAAWLRLMRSLDGARVSTIHAFCGKLLRSHAVELGLDPAFAVLDQASADVLLSEAIDTRIREGLQRNEEPVVTLAAEYDIRGLRSLLQALMTGPFDSAAAWRDRKPGEVVDAWKATHQERLVHGHLAEVASEPQIDSLVRLLLTVNEPKPTFADKQQRLLDLLPRLQEEGTGLSLLAEVRELLRFSGQLPDRYWNTEDGEASFRAAVKAVRDKIDDLKPMADDAELYQAAQLGQALLRQAVQVQGIYSDAKRSTGALDYDDLLREAHRLLTDPGHAATQRSLRRHVRLLLVDEFQDTDRLQADLVRALVGMDGGHESGEPTGGRLFFVGDFKQSIYRFRGAEPAVFRDLQQEAPPEGRLPLSKNFRSQPAVIDFVNHVFAEPFGEGYTPLSAARPQVTETPAAELLVTAPPDEKGNAQQNRQAEARAIASRLRTLFDEGTPVVADASAGEPRAARPGDVAILFQALSDVRFYEQALRDEGIEYYLVGGHAFYSQQEVHDVLHLLRSVVSQCDEVALAGVLRSPMFALEDETLFWMRQASGSLNGAIASRRTPGELSPHEADKLNRARRTLADLRSLRGRASASQVLRVAIERTGYDAALLAEFLGERKLANLDKLIEQARAIDNSGSNGGEPADGLERFARQLSEFTLRQPKEALASTTAEGADVVRLMTVHHAKGLEFPVVVLPDLGRKTRSDTDAAILDRDLGPLIKPAGARDKNKKGMYGIDLAKRLKKPEEQAEQLRKFYVACTRAADYLVLSAVIASPNETAGEWLSVLAERYDLATGEPIESNPADEGPAIRITPGDAALPPKVPPKKRVDRLRMVEQARADLGCSPGSEPAIEPLAIDPDQLRQFSVSRLTGKLHQARERPEGVALQHALRNKRDAIDPRGLGTLVHAVLESLPLGKPLADDDLARLCGALAPEHLRRHTDQAAEEAAEMVQRFVASEAWRSFADADRLEREVEFALDWQGNPTIGGGAWLRGYIDALSRGPEGRWWISDFKTNRVDAGGVQQATEPYRLQLGVYAMAAERALGEPPAGTRLCFLRPGVTVNFDWNDAEREATIKLVNEAIARVRADVNRQPIS